MKHNILYSDLIRKHCLLNIDLHTLSYILNAYRNGERHIKIKGDNIYFSKSSKIKIFENSEDISTDKIIQNVIIEKEYDNNVVSELYLSRLGKEKTLYFLKNKNFGDEKNIENLIKKDSNYINESRLDELKKIQCISYDLTKLIQLCNELNFNFANENYYSVAMIGRAIIDHIPPIFGLSSFNEVANNYGSKSIRKSLTHLNNSMRSISDGILHSNIRKNESLPNDTQVNFSQDLDVLLGEIISHLKSKII